MAKDSSVRRETDQAILSLRWRIKLLEKELEKERVSRMAWEAMVKRIAERIVATYAASKACWRVSST